MIQDTDFIVPFVLMMYLRLVKNAGLFFTKMMLMLIILCAIAVSEFDKNNKKC